MAICIKDKYYWIHVSFILFYLFFRRDRVELESLSEFNQCANKWQPCVGAQLAYK